MSSLRQSSDLPPLSPPSLMYSFRSVFLSPNAKNKCILLGHFRCGACAGTWGSSRAIGNVGQQCHACALAGSDGQFVQPFRVEVFRSGGRGGGGARRARRVPREAIPEDDVAPASNAYSTNDFLRHKSGGRNALAAGGGDGFDWVDVKVEEGERPSRPDGAPPSVNKFAMMRHKCTGCALGDMPQAQSAHIRRPRLARRRHGVGERLDLHE